jgi:hypothetical protein
VRLVVQDSVVELATAAVWTGVLDVHVVVEMLASAPDKKAINQALATFSSQHWMHVVPHQPATDQDRMRRHVCRSSLLDSQRGNVEGVAVFALNHVVRDVRVISRNQFGHTVRKHRSATERNVFLDHRALALILENKKIARMRHERQVVGRRNEQQVDRRLDHDATLYVHVCAIFDKSRIQGNKCCVFA